MILTFRIKLGNHDDDNYDDDHNDNGDAIGDLPNVVRERSLLCGRGELVGSGFLQTYNGDHHDIRMANTNHDHDNQLPMKSLLIIRMVIIR